MEVIGHHLQHSKFVLPESCGPSLHLYISLITNIPTKYLAGYVPNQTASIAQRMGWASKRETTREEDEAYCLLGIFGINMPLLYGEGRKAFLRLQEEIIKRSTDQSIFAWGRTLSWDDKVEIDRHGLLAESPCDFRQVVGDATNLGTFDQTYSITNNGLEMRAKLIVGVFQESRDEFARRFMLKLNAGRVTRVEQDHVPGQRRFRKQVFTVYVPLTEIAPRTYERACDGLYELDSKSVVRRTELDEQLIYLRTGLEIATGKALGYEDHDLFDVSD